MNKIKLAPNDFMRQHFACMPRPIKGDPEGQLFSTKMGAHPTYHLYRNEAEALMVNIGMALGIDVEGVCNAHDQLVAALKLAHKTLSGIDSQNCPFQQYDSEIATIGAALAAAEVTP